MSKIHVTSKLNLFIYMLAIAEEGEVAEADNRFHLSQSAISHSLKPL